MDLCVVDWRAVTTLLASLIASSTALYISNKWKGQKGGEVVANEARQTIKDLLEIIKIVHLMASKNSTLDEYEEDFKTYKLLYESVVRSGLYINDCVEIDGFKEEMNKFFEHCRYLMWIKSEFKAEIESRAAYIGSTGIAMVNILIPYSTYQKKFIFKNKKVKRSTHNKP